MLLNDAVSTTYIVHLRIRDMKKQRFDKYLERRGRGIFYNSIPEGRLRKTKDIRSHVSQ